MSIHTTASHNRGPIEAYRHILDHDQTKWSLYSHLAAILPTEAEKSHIYLQGAWRALERGEYIQAQEFSTAAERVYGRTFRSRLVDIELLKRQGQSAAIPKKLLEIADTFKRKNLPAEEVKAYKRLAILDPKPAYYQRVMILYTQIDKVQKASEWASKLAKMTPLRSLDPLPTREKSVEAKELNSTNQILTSKSLTLPDIAFGKALWSKYFGYVGEEPPLPHEIDEILNSPCPFFPEEKICNTHMLVLIPQAVNGVPLNLKTLGELVQKPLRGKGANYGIFNFGKYTDSPALTTHWALMTRRVIPESQNKSYKEQYDLLQGKKAPYEVPTILDATICIFMEYFRTGSYLYGRDPLIFTRCQERYNESWQLAVGGFSPSGLDVNSHRSDFNCLGIAAARKFSNQIIDTFRKLPDIAFGKALWAKYFGDIGIEPPLPSDIDQILDRSCPIWPDKKVRDTHLLVLVPHTVNGKPLTLKTLGELIQKPLNGNAAKYNYIYLGEYSDPPTLISHWTLMTRNVIPGTERKSYQEQRTKITHLKDTTDLPYYQVPAVLDAAVCILMEYVRTGSYIYGREPLIYTHCQEKYYNDNWQFVVGGFGPTGLNINPLYDHSRSYPGVAAMRKFF